MSVNVGKCPLQSVIVANAVLLLLNVACHLLDRQLVRLAADFETLVAFRIDCIALLHCILYIRCFLGNDFAVFIKDHLVVVPCQYESEKVAAGKISS